MRPSRALLQDQSAVKQSSGILSHTCIPPNRRIPSTSRMNRTTNRRPRERTNSAEREYHPNPPAQVTLLSERRVTQGCSNDAYKSPTRHPIYNDDDNDGSGTVGSVGPCPCHDACYYCPRDQDVERPYSACKVAGGDSPKEGAAVCNRYERKSEVMIDPCFRCCDV